MADLASTPKRIQQEETRFQFAVSESLAQKLGGTMNFLLDNYAIPPGAIFDFAGDEAAVPSGWIICDGRAVSRTTYVNLYTNISTLWGAGDGSTTFNVPDLRGAFTRMVDRTTVGGQKGRDPDHASRTPSGTGTTEKVGSYQADDVGSHTHEIKTQGGGSGGASVQSSGDVPVHGGLTTYAGGGNESRPKNMYVLKIIKT